MTDRLSATDAAFLYSEDAGNPLPVGGVVILDPSVAGDPDRSFAYADIVELIESRIALVPRYRQKVQLVPGRLARPVWVDDEQFDITFHVRRSTLAEPGTQGQLDELVGRLISRPLDRSRPLWEVYVVEGLEGGRVAVVNKTHQALVDRIGAVDVAAAILDLGRRPRDLPLERWVPAPPPSGIDLVIDAVADLLTRPTELLDTVRLASLDVRHAVNRLGSLGSGVVDVVRRTVTPAPRSLLTVTRSGQRRFATFVTDLAGLKRIRAANGGSVNDVILAVVAGALRSWLLAQGETVTPTSSLRALVPVSVRPGHRSRSSAPEHGDQDATAVPVQSFLIDLPIAEPNPVVRLHQLSYAMSGHLASSRQVGADALLELGRLAPPTLHALGARVASQLSSRTYNVLITNVPGPQVPLYAAGWPVAAMYPVAPLGRGHALAVAVTSYSGGVYFGLTADRDAIGNVEEFAEHFGEAIEELLPPSAPPPRPRRVGPRKVSP